MKFISIATSLALVSAQVYALFDSDTVEVLTSDNFAEKVDEDTDNAWVITFYADWCPYCKTFDTEFDLASKDTKLADKKIKFGSVDVMANRDLTSKFGIKRSPTVKLFGTDKAAPTDYLGHRKQDDLVTHCDEFCTENEFTKPVEEKKENEFEYSIDPIVSQVATLHDARIIATQTEQKTAIEALSGEWTKELKSLNEQFEQKYNDLKKERNTSIQSAYDVQKEKVADFKTANASKINELDNEAIQAVTQIVNSFQAGDELTDTIPALGYDWIDIKWDATNRISKKQISAGLYGPESGYVPQYQNGYQVAGQAGLPQQTGYGASAQAAYPSYGGYPTQTQPAPYAPQTGGYGYGGQQYGAQNQAAYYY